MPKYLVVSTSGNPDSNSRRMGRVAFAHLQKRKVDCTWMDISEMDLPLCDADKCYLNQSAQKLNKAVETADGIMIAAPVYNYDAAAGGVGFERSDHVGNDFVQRQAELFRAVNDVFSIDRSGEGFVFHLLFHRGKI